MTTDKSVTTRYCDPDGDSPAVIVTTHPESQVMIVRNMLYEHEHTFTKAQAGMLLKAFSEWLGPDPSSDKCVVNRSDLAELVDFTRSNIGYTNSLAVDTRDALRRAEQILENSRYEAAKKKLQTNMSVIAVDKISYAQAIDWAYGNAKAANPNVTLEMAEMAVKKEQV